MPPKSRKGKEIASSSSSQPVSTLVHPYCRENFEKWQMKRKIVKQYTYDPNLVKNMHFPDVAALIEHQNIHPLVQCDTPYCENTVRAFYAGFTKGDGCNFSFKMGSRSHVVDKRAWISIFGLKIVGDELCIEDGDVPGIYDHVAYMKSILKDPSVFDKPNETITAGHVKRDPRLLNWVISRIIRPRAGGYSRIERNEVVLMYLLQNRTRIHWPHFLAAKFHEVQQKTTALCYGSIIQTIVNHFGMRLDHLHYTRIHQSQEFSQTTLTFMGYHWNPVRKTYYLIQKGTGKVIYNYDDPTEFGNNAGNEEEGLDQDNANDDDHHMEDVAQDTDANWRYVPPQQEDIPWGYTAPPPPDQTNIISMLENMQIIQQQHFDTQQLQFQQMQQLQQDRYDAQQQQYQSLYNLVQDHKSNFETFASNSTLRQNQFEEMALHRHANISQSFNTLNMSVLDLLEQVEEDRPHTFQRGRGRRGRR